MKKLKKAAAAAFSMMLMLTAVSCDKKKEQASEPLPEPPTEPEILEDPNDISGEVITWLADYDLNPQGNDERSVALALFEDVYGASVDFVRTTHEEKYIVFDEMRLSGQEVDMMPYDEECMPFGAYFDIFDPLDPYSEMLGMDEDIWDDIMPLADSMRYSGQYYVMPYSLSSPEMLIYSRKTIKKEKLDDPYELYLDGKWDRDTMMKLMRDFVDAHEEGTTRYGINGEFGKAALQSSGQTVISYDGSKFVNNIKDSKIKSAVSFMCDIASMNLYSSRWTDSYTSDGSVLFYAMSDWALKRSNEKNKDADLMVVPFPNAAGSDKNYVTCNVNAKMLAKGSAKGKAVAAYIKCERLAASDKKYTDPARERAISEGGITEEQYDAICSFTDPTKVTPVIEPAYGMGEKLNSVGCHTIETRGVMDNLTTVFISGSRSMDSWDELCDAWSDVVDEEIKGY